MGGPVNGTRMIDVNTATAEEVEELPEFIGPRCSQAWSGRDAPGTRLHDFPARYNGKT